MDPSSLHASYLKPQTPNTIKLNDSNVLTVHFTEFNVIMHQFYTTKFKSIFIDKTSYQKHDIHQLLLHSIKSKLSSIRNKLNNSQYTSPNIHAQTPSLELLHSPLGTDTNDITSPIDMNDLLFKHKMEQHQLRQQQHHHHQQQLLLSKPLAHKMTHSHTSSFNASSKGSPIFNDMVISPEPMFEHNDISNDMLLNVIDTPVSNILNNNNNNNESETYEEPDSESDSDASDTPDTESDSESDENDYDIDDIMKEIENEIHDQMNLGSKIGFADSGLYIECVDGKPEWDIYEFYAPHTLFQDGINHNNTNESTFNHLYRLNSARSDDSHDTDVSQKFSSTGNASPLSLLSAKPKSSTTHIENPFHFGESMNKNKDYVYLRQEYLYQYTQFFGHSHVYLTTQQMRFVDINPQLPEFMRDKQNELLIMNEPLTPFTPSMNSINRSTPKSNNRKRNRSSNIRDVAHRNTENISSDANGKISENKDLYDEDKKLASLLQSLVQNINYHFVPNGLLTHLQFIEFIDSLGIYNYDEYVLKHMFRYIYTDELPPTLPPPPIIEFNENETDNYNNVNGMYVAYSECIGYEYDEILDLIKELKVNVHGGNVFDDLLTTMVVERLQTIYQSLKFDDLDAHPNIGQAHNKLNGDELKENVFNFFDDNNITNNIKDEESHYTHTAISTMRSTDSQTLTYNGLFRRSIISADGLNNLLSDMKKDKLDKTIPKLMHNTSTSTTTITHYNPTNPQTPLTPNTQISFDKYEQLPTLIDINDIPMSYHNRIQSLQSKLMKKGSSLNALVDYDDKSPTTTTHKSPTNNNINHSDDDEKDINNSTQPPESIPTLDTQLSNDSSIDIQIISPNTSMKRKKQLSTSKRQYSASRQPSLPTLPEEHIDSIHNLTSNKEPLSRNDVDINSKVDQLFATIGSDQVHIDLLKYGLKLIEISFNKFEEEHYFLRVLQSYRNKTNNSNNDNVPLSPQRFFVHKDWIKQFLYDDDIPHSLRELQSKIITNLQRKQHLLVSELSRRSSNSFMTNSSYPISDDTYNNSNNRYNNIGMPRELQQTYVIYFKQTLQSRTKALTQYTNTRYTPTHQKYWRDVFFFMSKGAKYLDRSAFKDGIERCGIKIRTGNKYKKKTKKIREIEKILNAVFVEMDYENTGYITVHAFTAMMMSDDKHLLNPNTNANTNGNSRYNYNNTNTLTVPRKMHHNHNYYHMPPQQHQQPYYGQQYMSNNKKKHNKMKRKQNNTRNYNNNTYQKAPNFVEKYSLSSNNDQHHETQQHQMYYQEVEEKIHQINVNNVANTENENKYLNNIWNSGGYNNNNNHNYNNEEPDEKIPMLEVLENHQINMQKGNNTITNTNTNTNKSKKKHKKKKSLKSSKKKLSIKEQSLKNSYSFIVTRKKLNSLDLIQRRYYLTIQRETSKIILSPINIDNNYNNCEVSIEFGLHQIIDSGDYPSTEIQIKTKYNKKIYYEFDIRQSRDEFIDLLEEVKHETINNNINLDYLDALPHGTGFYYNNDININKFEEDVDPIYDDECSICVSKLLTHSTIYWFIILSIFNCIIIYLIQNMFDNNSVYDKTDILLVWILINIIFLRLSTIQLIRSNLILQFSKIFDCVCFHKFFYYGFSTHSLMTIWIIFWILWNTLIIGNKIWNNVTNPPIELGSFAFIVLSLTFLTFAQFAYCRCRCCSVTMSELLHNVLQRLSCVFISIYGVLYCIKISSFNVTYTIKNISFWLSIILICEFIFYAIYIYILKKDNIKIKGSNINLRVLSEELCELQLPFNIKPFEYIWVSDDRVTWIKLPILLTTNNSMHNNNNIPYRTNSTHKHKRNVEENPYHHQENSSNEAIELTTMNDIYKLKSTLKRTKNINKYEAVGGGFNYQNDRTELMSNNNNNNNNICCVIMHSRNKIGQRIIDKASNCFEQADFNLYVKKYNCPLTIMCFAFVYKQIGIIATDDRIIPAISYIFNKQNQYQYIEILWIVNKPKQQYINLYQLLNLNKNQNQNNNIKIIDMAKKKSSKERHITNFLNNTSSQAIFALTSRYTGMNIKKLSKNAAVYMQHTEWY